jgi:hypothetical protein
LEASARYRRSDVLQHFEILVRRPESYGAYDNIFSPKCVTHVTNALNTSLVYLIFNLLAAGPAAREKDIGWALLQAGLACVLTNLFLINLPNRNAVFATTRLVVIYHCHRAAKLVVKLVVQQLDHEWVRPVSYCDVFPLHHSG